MHTSCAETTETSMTESYAAYRTGLVKSEETTLTVQHDLNKHVSSSFYSTRGTHFNKLIHENYNPKVLVA